MTVFLPSLFFVQTGSVVSEQNVVISSVVQTLRAEPAPFYAVLTVAAAHRSLLRDRRQILSEKSYIPDPVFHAMEERAFKEFNRKLSGPGRLENSSFETILALIGATVSSELPQPTHELLSVIKSNQEICDRRSLVTSKERGFTLKVSQQ